MFKKSLAAASVAIALAGASMSASAAAPTAQGITTFTIALSPTVVLDYYKSIALTISSANIGALAGTSNNPTTAATATATVAAGALTANVGLTTAASASMAAVPLTLNNVYSIRSINTSGGATTVTIGLSSQAGTTLTLSNGAASIVATAPTTTVTGNGTLAAPVYGSVGMSLNFTNASLAGTYASTGTGAGQDIYINATAT